MFDKIVNMIDRTFAAVSNKVGKNDISDYIDLETADSETVLVSKSGALLTILKINGTVNLLSNVEYEVLSERLAATLASFFKKRGNKIQLFFEYDPDNTQQDLRETLKDARATNKRLKLGLDDVLNERETNLLKWTCSERCYIALYTTPEAMSKGQAENRKERYKEFAKSTQTPITKLGQNPLMGVEEIAESHFGFVSTFRSALSDFRIDNKILNVKDALYEIRRLCDRDSVSEEWKPFLPGDRIFPNVKMRDSQIEIFDIMYPKLSYQLTPSPALIRDFDTVEIGNRIYSSVYFELFPQEIQSFQNLFVETRYQKIPYRYSMLIDGDGMSGVRMKALFAQILAFTNGSNKLIKRDVDNIQYYEEAASNVSVGVRTCFSTWSNKDEPKLLKARFESLKNILNAWGNPELCKTTGDPVAGFFSAVLGATEGSIATKSAAPLSHLFYMTALSRPCSPWERGAVVFRTPDGKIIPYEPFSSKQTTWVSIISAKPGSGKSVLMNICHLALCLNPGITQLPRIGIIDIGPSSAGFISLIKEGLPPERRHEAMYHKVRNIKSESINPFDTPIGMREPCATDMAFLINFVGLLITDPTLEKPPEGSTGLVKRAIEEVYLAKSDEGSSPKRYSPYECDQVDVALKTLKEDGFVFEPLYSEVEYGIEREPILWWQVVDFLFEHGRINDAKIAQRHASPLLIDLIEVVSTDKIKAEYGNKSSEGETLIQSFIRNLRDAISYYPVLTDITKFDIDMARIVSLDLDEVAKSGGASAERMTSIMYMLARYLIAKDYYIDADLADEVPIQAASKINIPSTVPVKKYKAYHAERGANIKKEQKRIAYDEFHKVSTTKARDVIVKQVLDDIRIGRKYQVDMMLASQILTDFNDDIISQSTSIFILDGSSKNEVDNIKQKIGIDSEAIEYALINQVRGPREGGGIFLSIFRTNEGVYNMLTSATLGPIELWAFTTTAADAFVRNGLYKVMKPSDARVLLAKKFPSGSIKNRIAALMQQKEKENRLNMLNEESRDVKDDIYNTILKDLIQDAKEMGYTVLEV